VRILKCAKRAANLHKLIDFKQNAFADFVRQGNERQTADDITDLAQTGFLMNPVRLGRIAQTISNFE
jgi:hypothetical protein